ncbi:MAG: helix-turn-helix domain-containing protein [Verrucomicrobiota bacterium]|jgi:transposase
MNCGRPKPELVISDSEIECLQTLADSSGEARMRTVRCEIVYLSSQGLSNREIARILNVSQSTVSKWRKVFIEDGLQGLLKPNYSGRHTSIREQDLKRIFDTLLCTQRQDGKAWSCRSLAAEVGVPKSNIQRLLANLCLTKESKRKFAAQLEGSDGQAVLIGIEIDPVMSCAVFLRKSPLYRTGCQAAASEVPSPFSRWIEQIERQSYDILHAIAEGNAGIENTPSPPLMNRVMQLNGEICDLFTMNIVFNSLSPGSIRSLLVWKVHHPNVELCLCRDKAEWLRDLNLIRNRLLQNEVVQSDTRIQNAIRHFFEYELHKTAVSNTYSLWIPESSIACEV